MKFILVPLLIMLLLSQAFSKWLLVIEYNMNKDFISQKLCINKAKPKLHCNGRCQMMKRLAEEEKQNSSNTNNNTSRIKIQESVFSNEIVQLLVPLPLSSAISYNEEPPVFVYSVPASSIFHPPALG